MEIKEGSVVRSKAGRDKNGYFIVTKCDGVYAFISDGKGRRLEKPKRKKYKHLSLTNTVVEISSMSTNREIRKALSEFNKND